MALAGAALLAHGSGWDEAAILLGPVIVFLVLRYMGRSDAPPADPDDASATGDGPPAGADGSAPGDAAGDPADPTGRGEAS